MAYLGPIFGILSGAHHLEIGMTKQMDVSPIAEDDRLAWAPDIVDLLAGRDAASGARYRLISDELEVFVSDDKDTHQIVSGTRGMGKSASLYYKAARLSKNKNVVLALPTHPFTFRLPPMSIKVPAGRVATYEAQRAWTPLWMLVLGTIIGFVILKDKKNTPWSNTEEWLNRFKVPPKSDEAEFFQMAFAWAQSPHQEKISALATWLIARGIRTDTQEHWYRTYVEHTHIVPDDQKTFAMFVDAIDEAIGGEVAISSTDSKTATNDDGNLQTVNVLLLSEQIWISAQTGFAEAAYRFRTATNHRIKIYGSMRTEAANQFAPRAHLTESKVTQFILALKYSKTDLQAVFNHNVSLTSQNGLASPDAIDPIMRFFGRNQIPNIVVWGGREDIISALLRHTFGSPRDIVIIGGYLRRHVQAAARIEDTDSFMPFVKAAAQKVLWEHLQNVYPPWNTDYERGFCLIHSNILTYAEVAAIEVEFSTLTGGRLAPLFSYLYERQLIGIPVPRTNNNPLLEFFRPGAGYQEFPREFNYCAIHPALSAVIRLRRPGADNQKEYYRGHFVVGDGLVVPTDIFKTRISVGSMERRRGVTVNISGKIVPGRQNEAFALLVAMLCAIKRAGMSNVSVAEIAKEGKWLCDHSYIPDKIGHQYELAAPFEFFLRTLRYEQVNQQPYIIRSLKDALKPFNLTIQHDGNTDGYFSLSEITALRDVGRDIDPGEVAINLPNL